MQGIIKPYILIVQNSQNTTKNNFKHGYNKVLLYSYEKCWIKYKLQKTAKYNKQILNRIDHYY